MLSKSTTNFPHKIATLAGTSLVAACCFSCDQSRRVAPTTSITAADFSRIPSAVPRGGAEVPSARTNASPDQPLDVNAPGNDAASTRTFEVTGPIGASEGISDAVASPGPPVLGAGDVIAVGEPVLVDAKIGDINGKPVYASTFFDIGTPTQEPLGPRLASESRERTTQDWASYAQREINQRLDLIIQDELLRAEALSTLSPNEKQGLFAFVERLQKDRVREAGGSREALKRELEGQGVTVEEWTRKREQTELVRYQIQQKILRRVNVSWRDIEQAYNGRFYDAYHHPPRYKFYLLTIPATATDDRAAVEKDIAADRPFEEIAGGTLNRFRNERGGLEIREVPGDVAQASFFPNPALNDAAKQLSEKQTSQPVTMGENIAWLHLAAIERAPILYDAQLEIEDRLHRQRVNEALSRYLVRLQGRGNVSSIPEMRARLLEIAAERYSPGPGS